MITKEFNIVNDKIKSSTEEGTLIIEGIANTGERDLVGDVITSDALEQIAEQAPNRNLHLNHNPDLDGIIGVITSATVEDLGVRIKSKILDEYAQKIKSLLDAGVKLGLSIAGKAHYEENSWEQIESWDLTEISLTPLPCDQGTMGTVQVSKSFNDFLSTIQKNTIGGNKMADETITAEAVTEMINAAFNEKEEELLETVRKEFEEKFGELNTRIEALENAEPKPTEPPVEGEGEGKAEDEEEDKPKAGEDVKPEDEEEEDKADEDEEEEEEKKFQTAVNKAVDSKLKSIFGEARQTPIFKYSQENKSSTPESNKSFTPREIAKMLTGDE